MNLLARLFKRDVATLPNTTLQLLSAAIYLNNAQTILLGCIWQYGVVLADREKKQRVFLESVAAGFAFTIYAAEVHYKFVGSTARLLFFQRLQSNMDFIETASVTSAEKLGYTRPEEIVAFIRCSKDPAFIENCLSYLNETPEGKPFSTILQKDHKWAKPVADIAGNLTWRIYLILYSHLAQEKDKNEAIGKLVSLIVEAMAQSAHRIDLHLKKG